MPQLDPRPWFAILVFAWLLFLAFLPQKVLAHLFLNKPASQSLKTSKPLPFNWKWH